MFWRGVEICATVTLKSCNSSQSERNMKGIGEIITLLKQEQQTLAKKYHIQTLGVFGSVSRGRQTSASDVDIVVECDPSLGLEFAELIDELEALLATRVDVVTRSSLKPDFWKRIERDIIYAWPRNRNSHP